MNDVTLETNNNNDVQHQPSQNDVRSLGKYTFLKNLINEKLDVIGYPNNISLLWNTDGILKPSKSFLWPMLYSSNNILIGGFVVWRISPNENVLQ